MLCRTAALGLVVLFVAACAQVPATAPDAQPAAAQVPAAGAEGAGLATVQREPAMPAAPEPVAETGKVAAPPPPANLWARIRAGFRLPDANGPLVHDWEQWYSTRPDYVARMVERSSRYLYHVVEEVERRKMPAEIALLPMIESAYNPQAYSSSHASGMWQFIPSTGKLYGCSPGQSLVSRGSDQDPGICGSRSGEFGPYDIELICKWTCDGIVSS